MTPPISEAEANLRDASSTASAAARKPDAAAAAKTASTQSEEAVRDAQALTAQARQIHDALAKTGDSASRALADAQPQQNNIGQSVGNASDTLQKAARHESRLNPVKAFEMLELSGNVEMLAKGELPTAQKQISDATTPAIAEPPARSAQKSIQNAAEAVQAAAGGGKQGQESTGGKSPDAAAAQEGKAMARALDQLDSALNKPQQGQQAQSGQQAMSNLSQSQQEAARNQRQQSGQSEATGAEGFYIAKGEPGGNLPNAGGKAGGDWGKLPPQLARELIEGQRDGSGGEYRSMIDTYFRVIAEKARASAP
jgi:hypothetical protein